MWKCSQRKTKLIDVLYLIESVVKALFQPANYEFLNLWIFRSCTFSREFFIASMFASSFPPECKLFWKLNRKNFSLLLRPETLCVFITQRKLHESMQNFILEIIYHTRKMIFYFVRETNLLEETSENCIKRRYIIASQVSILSPLKLAAAWMCNVGVFGNWRERKIVDENQFILSGFQFKWFSFPSNRHWTV